MWVVDPEDRKVYAYALAGGARHSGKDFDLHADNASAWGVWSDGATMWVAEPDADKLFAYHMPVSAVSASVEGASVTVVFDRELDAASGVDAGAFTVRKVPYGNPAGWPRETAVSVSGVAVSGRTVTLTLASPVAFRDRGFTVSYTPPAEAGRQLRSPEEVPADAFDRLPAAKTGATPGVTAEVPVSQVIRVNRRANATGQVEPPDRDAQGFTAPSGSSGWAVAQYGVEVSQAASDTLEVSLHADRGGEPGRLLHRGEVVLSTNGQQTAAVSPDAPLALEPGGKYFIQVRATSGSFVLPQNGGVNHVIAPGWSVADESIVHTDARGWRSGGGNLKMMISVDAFIDLPASSGTPGLVREGVVSSGTLNEGDKDAWWLELVPGRRYRLELDFGDDPPTADRGGRLSLVVPGPTGALDASVGGFDADGFADDGRAFIDFGYYESGDWTDAGTGFTAATRGDIRLHALVTPSSAHYDPDNPNSITSVAIEGHEELLPTLASSSLPANLPHHGDYTLTLTDITGTVAMVGNTSKYYLGGDGAGSDYSILSWEVGRYQAGKNFARAQQFTTGKHTAANGYFALDRVEAYVHALQNNSSPQIAIHADSSSAPAATALCTLDSPLAYRKHPEELARFVAPAAGCRLETETKYWVVFSETSTTASAQYKIDIVDTTAADRRDFHSDLLWGWDGKSHVADLATTTTTWTSNATRALQFKVIANPNPRRAIPPAQSAPANAEARGAPAITGTVQVGQTLTADTSGISDPDGLENATFGYQWLANGSELGGATGQSYTVGELVEGQALSVRVTFTDDAGNEESLTSAATEAVPVDALTLESATVDGATLTLTYSELLNVLVDLPETAFTVTVNGSAVSVSDSSVSGSAVTLTLASAVAAGDTVTVGYEQPEGNRVIGDLRGRVAESFSGQAVTNETPPPPLTASASQVPESHDGSAEFTFQLHFSEEFGLSYVTLRDHAFTVTGGSIVNARRLTPPSNVGWEITVEPSGDGTVTLVLPVTTDCEAQGAICTGDGKALSERLEVVVPVPSARQSQEQTQENQPATGAPTISGTARVGETLSVSTAGIADADGLTNVSYAYQWLADDAVIAGATSSTYTLAAAERGKAIKVTVSFTDDAGNAEALTSVATATVTAANNPATGSPVITGTAQVGQTLSVSTAGIADADGLTNVSYAYQWLVDDAVIAG
ncbi:MAG: hypothetical protein F4Y02_11165, partial [Chloroflexi bacterium]|nr:hypothetical protein [Chloroflexota bacterium]